MTKTVTRLPVKTERVGKEALMTWAPFENLRRDIDRVFEDFYPGGFRFPFGRTGLDFDLPRSREMMTGMTLPVDFAETEKDYEVTADLPGMEEKDIEIKLVNNTLTIKGEKTEEKEEHEKDYYMSERSYGSFMRTMRVPEGVDMDKIEATLDKGVLTVRLPKTVEAQKAEKKVEVKAA